MKFEYIVCLLQKGRVTFANDQWQGKVALDGGTTEEAALESCPKSWEFLNKKGAESWELVAAAPEIAKGELTGLFSDQLQLEGFTSLYLRRAS